MIRNFHAANGQLIAVLHCAMRKSSPRFLAKDNLGAGSGRQFLMAADEVRVQVRFDDVLDLEILRRRFFDVLVDVTLRIDDRGFAF